jgi:hypothetical protein
MSTLQHPPYHDVAVECWESLLEPDKQAGNETVKPLEGQKDRRSQPLVALEIIAGLFIAGLFIADKQASVWARPGG